MYNAWSKAHCCVNRSTWKELGLQGSFLFDAIGVFDGLAVAAGEGVQGPISVLEGDIDVAELLELAVEFVS